VYSSFWSFMLEPAPGTQIAGRYRLTRQLGAGGMGSVWAATDEKLRREVAIKLVTERIAESEKALGRFEREAMSVARLRSPYIAQVYDYGVEGSSPYIIMELLEGEDLKSLLDREGRLSLESTAKVVVQIAKALHAAHQAGIVHRDLKPANVFLAREGGEEVVKVFDFGVAKALNDLAQDGDTTAEGVLLGTPRFMSPEQAHGAKRVDHRSDLWSLGVIAYMCVTGRLPFLASGTGHLLVKICTEDAPRPSDLVGHLGPHTDTFFSRALAKDADARFQSARELAAAFAELAGSSPSQFLVGGVEPTPSWEGGRISDPSGLGRSRSGLTGDRSKADPSGERSGLSVRQARSADDPTSREIPSSSRQSGDGTLGAHTHTLASPWHARRARIGAAVIAAVALAALAAVAFVRFGGSPASTPAATPAAAQPAPLAPPAETATATPAPPPAAPAEPSATAAEKPSRIARGHAGAPPAKTAEPEPPPPPAPPPQKQKGSGDGLDLFNKRW
jgi:eukaryotic-like serine/threonine-protein kinase